VRGNKVNKMAEAKNKPKRKLRLGNVTATVWENEIVVKGQKRTVESVTFSKIYKDKEGNWQNTNSYSRNEVPRLLGVILGYLNGQIVEGDTSPSPTEVSVEDSTV
jgi:hypothetical protein